MSIILALAGGGAIGDYAIWIIIVAAIVAIVWIALAVFKISPPAWAIQMFWVLVVAFVAILAIRFLMSL